MFIIYKGQLTQMILLTLFLLEKIKSLSLHREILLGHIQHLYYRTLNDSLWG